MTHEEKQLKELLHGFAEQTTAHGISQIASSKSLFWRIFWVLVTLGGGGMVIYQGILLVNTYMSKPIKSDIDITYRRVGSVRCCHFSMNCIVQSLNSTFFPPHIGAEPGRAKEESRITCMRMLRTNQSKITRSQPRCSRQCVAQCLSQLAL